MRHRLVLLTLALLACASGVHAQPVPSARTVLYRFEMIQAGPGKSGELATFYRDRVRTIVAGGDEAPVLVRHSQGDRWDLLVISPIGTLTDFYSRERVAKRDAAASASGLSSSAFAAKLEDMSAWHEDVLAWGPPVAELRALVKDMSLAHLEMLEAAAGKKDELVKERQMENVYNAGRGRPSTLIFVREIGASYDVITIDTWKDWKQYGELQMIPAAASDAAAKAAGFANADAVGVYMRQLITTHHDTLGPIVVIAK